MAAVHHIEFAKFWYFFTWPSLEPKSAAAHRISLKSDDPRLRYGDETILKMAAVRHLEFLKIAIYVTWRVSEHGSTCTYQISHQSDNNSWKYSQKTIFNMAAIRHFEFHIFFTNQHVTVLGTNIWDYTLNFIEIGWFPAEIYRVAIKPFSKWRPSAIFNSQNLVFWSRDLCLNVILLFRTKFRVNRTINRRDITKTRFLIWRPSGILNLQYFDTLSDDRH